MRKLAACILAIMMFISLAAGTVTAEEIKLTREDAMAAALEAAGLTEDQVTFVKVREDMDHGRLVWKIEFVCDGVEYEFEVDYYTGEILDSETERYHDDWDDDLDYWFDFD